MGVQATVALVLLQVALVALHLVTGLRTGWLVAVYAPTVPHHLLMAVLDVLTPLLAVFAAITLTCPRAVFARRLEAALWARATVLPLLLLVAVLRPIVVNGLPIDPDRFPNLLRLDQATVGTWLAVATWALGTALCVGGHAWSMGRACAPTKLGAGRFVFAFLGAAVVSQAAVSLILRLVA
ncbi:MAG: hypothetical protein HPY44_19615 [Armatimonadetes bacterium]|nr:hypothetical protein [Armatimonadota bacterium]